MKKGLFIIALVSTLAFFIGCGGIQVTVINTTSHDNSSSDTAGNPRDLNLKDYDVTKEYVDGKAK